MLIVTKLPSTPWIVKKLEDHDDNDTEGSDDDQDEDGGVGEGPVEPSQIMGARARTEGFGVAGRRPNVADEFAYWLRLASARLGRAACSKPLISSTAPSLNNRAC